MPKYDNDMRGALFKNTEKKTEKHPDYKGNCEISGVEFWVSAWIKEAESGRKYMSLSFHAKEATKTAKPPKGEYGRDDGEIPF